MIARIRAGCAVLCERYRRDQGLIDKLLVLSVALLIVITAMAALDGSGVAVMLAVTALGLATGSGLALILGLGTGFRELRRRDRERKDIT